MIAASTYLPSASSSATAASSIHGTGAQNFSIAIRNGCSDVSGIAWGPNFSGRRRASSLVRPFCGLTSAALADLGFIIALTLKIGHFGRALDSITGVPSVFAVPAYARLSRVAKVQLGLKCDLRARNIKQRATSANCVPPACRRRAQRCGAASWLLLIGQSLCG